MPRTATCDFLSQPRVLSDANRDFGGFPLSRGLPMPQPGGEVGRPEGRQSSDTTDMKTNVVNPGIFALISRATCVDLSGTQRCVSLARPPRGTASRKHATCCQCRAGRLGPVMELGADHRRIEG